MFEIEEPEKMLGDGEEGGSSTNSTPLRDIGLSPTRQPMIPSSRSK